MKKTILFILCFVMLFAMISCNKSKNIDQKNPTKNTNENLQESTNSDSTDSKNNNTSMVYESKSMPEILTDILQKQYTWREFSVIYPKYEVTARSTIAMNVMIPEFENVVFVFSGAVADEIDDYKMASVNIGADVVLPEHYNKTFDEILLEEGNHASYVLADDIMQHLYKYEDIYIYRDSFYYYIRGYRHGNNLSNDHIAMFRYDENHIRPW